MHTNASLPRRPVLLNAAVYVVVALAAVAARIDHPSLSKPFGTDEADYVRALSFGFGANYLGTRERTGFAFLRDVVREYRATGWARPFARDWEQEDAAGLRHYHPPVGLYPVAALVGRGVRHERTLRLVPVTLGVLTCVFAAMLAGSMTEPRGQPLASLVAGLLTASSPYHVAVSTELSFHAAFALLLTLCLLCLVMTTRRRTLGWWYAASAMFGLSVLTVPYWLLIVPAYTWVAWSTSRHAGVTRTSLSALAIIVGTWLVAWPPFVLAAGAVKPALMYGGILLKPLPGSSTSGGWLAQLAATHWLTTLCLAAGLAGLALKRLRARPMWVPTAIFLAGFVLINARVAHMKPLYAGDTIAPLTAMAAASVVSVSPVLSVPAAVAATLSSIQTIVATRQQPLPTGWRTEMRALVRSLNGATVLVTPRPAGPMLTYYAAGARVVVDSSDVEDGRVLRQSAARGEMNAVLQWGPSAEPGGVARDLLRGEPDATFTIDQTVVRLTWLTAPTGEPAVR